MNTPLLPFKTILVIEDNSISQLLVKHILSCCGIQSQACESGMQAIELLRQKSFDLILMDINLPGLTGFETAELVRRDLGLSTPIFAMTSLLLEPDEQKCFECGMNGYVPKPFTANDLLSATEKFLAKRTVNPQRVPALAKDVISITAA